MGAELIRLIELHDGLGVPTGLGEGKPAVEVLACHCPGIDLSAGGGGKHPSSERAGREGETHRARSGRRHFEGRYTRFMPAAAVAGGPGG